MIVYVCPECGRARTVKFRCKGGLTHPEVVAVGVEYVRRDELRVMRRVLEIALDWLKENDQTPFWAIQARKAVARGGEET